VRDETLSVHRALVAQAIEIVQRELDGDLRLADLADRIGLSAFHFHRLFSAIAGEPPATYLRRLRLERAALRLQHSRLPVTDIAFAAGYQTHESFTRAFKSRFGVPPSRFRAERARPDETIDIEPSIVRLPPRRIAFVRHVGPYDQTGAAFEKVVAWAGPRGLLPGATLLGVYWDDQRITPPDRTRCEVGLVVDDLAVGDGEVGVRSLPGGEYAVFRHRGSPHDRQRSYDLLYARWLPERGRAAANAPPIEVYSTYRGVLEGIDLVTSVHVPLEPSRAA
jgi:AraC family transcriptional regulator